MPGDATGLALVVTSSTTQIVPVGLWRSLSPAATSGPSTPTSSTTVATKRKHHLPGLWTAKHQAEARTRGWSLQWVFDAQGQILLVDAQLLREAKTTADALADYGAALTTKDDWKSASEMFKRAIAVRPNDELFHVNYARVLDKMGEKESRLQNVVSAGRSKASIESAFQSARRPEVTRQQCTPSLAG